MLATPTAPTVLKMLAHDLRWQLLRALAASDLRVQELIDILAQPQNLVSYHLRKLADSGLVREQRSIADRRAIYYSLDLPYLRQALSAGEEELHPALPPGAQAETDQVSKLPPYRVLFLCTHNSARSQMAEGLLRAQSGGRLDVHSAGTEATEVRPLAIRAMQALNIDIRGQFSKTLERYYDQRFDYIITVCDRARESCPIFPGDPVRIHWSMPDPAAVEGDEETRYKAFLETAIQLKQRISFLLLSMQRGQTSLSQPKEK